MRIQCDLDELRSIASWVSRAVSNKPANPILAGILVESDGTRATFTATDFDLTHVASIEASGQPGRALVPGKDLVAYLGAIRGDSAFLSVDGDKFVVKAGKSQSRFGLMGAGFPELPPPPSEVIGRMTAGELQRLISRLDHGVSKEPVGGMVWTTAIALVTTDGVLRGYSGSRYRQARSTLSMAIDADLLVPGKMLANAAKDLVGDVVLTKSDSALAVTAGEMSATLRLIADTWPGVSTLNTLYESAHEWQVVFDREELLDTLRRLALADDRVRIEITENEATLVSYGSDDPRKAGEETTACQSTLDGTIMFSTDYLIGAISSLSADEILLATKRGGKSPVVIADNPPSTERRLVMPLKDPKGVQAE